MWDREVGDNFLEGEALKCTLKDGYTLIQWREEWGHGQRIL